jgi:hypothetical protein
MKKLLLIVLVLMLTTATAEAGWRHHVYVVAGVFGLYHPNGDWWAWECWINNGSGNVCRFKK